LLTVLAILGSAHAVCDQSFDHAIFVPAEGSTRVPPESELAVVVYGEFGKFGIDFEMMVTADGEEVPGQLPVAKHFQDERPDPGGFFVFHPFASLDTGAVHTIHLFHLEEEVASSSFEASEETIRPLSTVPLVQIAEVSDPEDRDDACGARTVRDVSLDIYPAAGDPLGVSYLELHLFPETSGVNPETIYDVIPVPAANELIEITIEVPDDEAAGYCITAFQVNGAGEQSGVSDPFACVNDYVSSHADDDGCGCASATPMGGLVSVLGFVFAAARRRRGSTQA
jgi:MYXO-CTERM domain-containing protein